MVATKIIFSEETGATQEALGQAVGLTSQWPRWSLVGRHWFKKTLLLITDVASVSLAHWIASYLIRRWMNIPIFDQNPSHYYLFYVPFFVLIRYFFEGYKSPDLRRPERELELIFKGVSVAFVGLTCANFVFFKSLGFSRYLLASWYALTLLVLLFARFGLRGMYEALWKRGLARQKALLLGPLDRLSAFRSNIAVQRYHGFDAVGVLAETGTTEDSEYDNFDLPVLGTIEQWEEVTDRCDIQLLLVGMSANSSNYSTLADLVRRAQEQGIQVEVYSDLFAMPEFKYERDEFSGFFRFYAPPRWSLMTQRAVKAVLDRMIGVVGSFVTILLTPVVGMLLKLEDGGPIFYHREFVGRDGQVHYYRKFRSMVKNADQLLHSNPELKEQFDHKHKLEQDPRVLRVGRFIRKYSIDEFPQFFSLLTGQLTFVGPRVISRAEKVRYGDSLPTLLSFKPGMTGYWQVMGRQTTSYEERVRMDMFYIAHWSIWLDLIIIGKTFWRVLRADGAY